MKHFRISLTNILILLILFTGSCRRRHRNLNREISQIEQYNTNRTKTAKISYSFKDSEANDNTKDRIKEIANSDDFDRMLILMTQASLDIRTLTKKYLNGHMTDNDMVGHLEEIQSMYEPVKIVLERASSEGRLTYKQHKKQMQILAEYIKTLNYAMVKVSNDMNNVF